jgi:Tol biopolymer transport system component
VRTSTRRLVVVAGLTGLATVACGGTGSHASGPAGPPSVTPPRLLFDMETNTASGRRDLYVVALDGTGLTRLTQDSADHHSPAATVSVVFFGSVRLDGSVVATVPASGGPAASLAATLNQADEPALSPDGQTLAYTSMVSGLPRIWTAHLDGSGAERLPAANAGWDGAVEMHPAWSPTGDRIAYASTRGGNASIWVGPAAGAPGSATLLTGSRSGASVEPAWSPDGSQVVFTSNRDGSTDLYVVAVASGAVTRLTRQGNVGQPVWLRDGRIVFTEWTAGVSGLDWIEPSRGAVTAIGTTGGAQHAAPMP